MLREGDIAWSAEAKSKFQQWLNLHRLQWAQEGADADEVEEDVWNHLSVRFSAHDGAVTTSDLRQALESMGLPPLDQAGVSHNIVLENRVVEPPKRGLLVRMGIALVTRPFWVLLWPLLVVLLDTLCGISEGMYVKPFNSWSQWLLVSVAFIAGIYHFRQNQKKGAEEAPLHTVLRHIGLSVAGYYSLIYLPLIVLGTAAFFMGAMYTIGLGLLLLPVYVVCVLIAGAPLLLFSGLVQRKGRKISKSNAILGLALGLAALVLVEGPGLITQYAVRSDKVHTMRKLGSMDALELMCDERGRVRDTSSLIAGLFDDHRSIEGTIMGGSRQKLVAKSRMMYYRVTGEAFEKVMGQSSSRNRRLLGSRQRDTAWDPDVNLGGDDVMGVWRDLKMSESRLDGHLDHASGLGYWEWTMKFKNEANIPREARMQILLPQHGVVSRLTLWVNGEPREAAFASTAKVAKAYKEVAVIQRRDPVLARWVGPDRVMVQCFPVPVNGEMKIRIGITAPVRSDGHWYLPRLIEQNYLIAEEMKTAVWVQGDSEFELDSLAGVGENGRWREVHGELSTRYLNQNYPYVRVLNRELPDRVWTIDPFALGEKKVLLAERTSKPKSDRDRPIVAVVDTSKGSEKWSQAIYDSLKAVSSQGREIRVVLAQDNGVEVLDSLDQLLLVDYWGGKDNQPALLKGFEIACRLKASDVIWFHADQPVRFEQSGALGQFVEHSLVKFTMSTVDLAGGANRVLEDLGKEIRIASQERPNSSAEMVAQVKAMLNGEESSFHWEYVESEAQVGDATKVWDQLARWRVWRDIEHSEPDKSLVELASKYQLVTPVSGAVVLETEEQYKRSDLEAIDESMAPSIPAVPEPSTFWLLMLAGVGLLARRDRTKSL